MVLIPLEYLNILTMRNPFRTSVNAEYLNNPSKGHNKATIDIKSIIEISLKGVGRVESLPCISSFVGADIVAGLNCIEYPEKGKYSMLIDLGTNAEIALFTENEVVCTSAAAGPCFEGVNISCGMSASDGAIYAYSRSGYKTVGNVVPKGICGTGLIDVVAELLGCEIDETGYMDNEEYKFCPYCGAEYERIVKYD